jgi:hypothetical protein
MALRKSGLTVAAAFLVGVAVAVSPSADAIGADGDSEDPDTNRLTAEEEAQGFELLFDGKTLDRWRGYRMDRVPDGWSVADGTIRFSPPDDPAAKRGDLITRDRYGDFELRLEWKVSPGGNSGIMFRVGEDDERTYHTGPEMQILDNAGHRDGANPATSAGANYALHAPSRAAARPVGEWNQVRMVVRGPHVEHWLNGEKVVEYELWSDDWKAKVAASKFAEWPGYGLGRAGHLALQDHGDEVWFRNLAVRRLDGGRSAR